MPNRRLAVGAMVIAIGLTAACSGHDEATAGTVATTPGTRQPVSTERIESEEPNVTPDAGAQTVPNEMPVDEVDGFLTDWFRGFAPPLPSTPDHGPVWSWVTTPPLPLEWPPTAATDWVRWVYARALDFGNVADGERIGRVWASVSRRPGAATAVVRLVTPQVTELGIQGVRPVDGAERTALVSLAEVAEQAATLVAEPDRDLASSIRAAYAAWRDTNRVIADTLPDAHDPFWSWVTQA